MEPTIRERHPAVGGMSEDELRAGEWLSEIEAEDLLGHELDLDEQDDWRAIDP